jgi:putative endonuclease
MLWSMKSEWAVYVLQCADDTFYIGCTNDMERRLKEHNDDPKGAKYTKARRPVQLRYMETCASRSEAQKREATLKKLTRSQKQELVLSSGHG